MMLGRFTGKKMKGDLVKDAGIVVKNLTKEIKKFFAEQGKQRAVLGLSGGIDSAVVLSLLVKALGPENVTALLMPNTALTKPRNMEDARLLADKLRVKHHVIEIDQFIHAFDGVPWGQAALAKANLNARIRAVLLYNYANSNNALVAGTGNKSEFYMGYFTKYGDAAADFFPIGALLKKEVRAIAQHMGLPRQFLEKAPSAELWPGQEDEKEMDIMYEVLDELLPLILEKKKVPRGKEGLAKKISQAIKATEHKRRQAPILKP